MTVERDRKMIELIERVREIEKLLSEMQLNDDDIKIAMKKQK